MKKRVPQRSGKEPERPAAVTATRAPLTRPGHPLSQARPEERAHPAQRKVKHKQRPGDGGD